jgi:hypothetical protein
MLTAKASVFHLRCVILTQTYCGKNADSSDNGQFFQLLSVFQGSVTRSRIASAAHQAIKNHGQSLLCACVQFQHSSLLCFESSVDLHTLVKIKGVP